MTDHDTPRALVSAYYATVYGQRDLEALERFLAPGFASAGPGGSMDLAGHRAALAASLAAIPDFALEIEEQVAEGNTVVTRWRATGTIHIHHVANGLILDQWEQFDALGVLRQLGVLPG